MPSIKLCAPSSAYPPSLVSVSKQALVCLAHALVANRRLSYAELLSSNSVSDVSAVVRQVRELLCVGHSQWRQWVEEAAVSHADGGEVELSSELSTSSSHSSTSAELSSPLSASPLPDSPASSASAASSRSPSPLPNPRRTLTIVTRANGKRSHPSAAARRHSAAVSSNSTTYMTADVFVQYFQHSRSLSEAVKRITRDYPSYREVSIYARARRLECRFDDKGRFYQPKGKAAAGNDGTNNNTGRGRESNGAVEEAESGEQEEEEEEGMNGARRRHAARRGRHRKVRRVEWESEDSNEDDEEDESDDDDKNSSSDGDDDMQSVSSYLSTSSSGDSSASSVSMLELSESSSAQIAAMACDATQPPSIEPAPDVVDALQLLAASAHSSASGRKDNEATHSTTANKLTSPANAKAPSNTAVKRVNMTASVSRSVVSAPPLVLQYDTGLPLTRRSLCAPSFTYRPLTALSVSDGPSALSFPFRSAGVQPPGSTGYGHLPVSPALRPVFGSPNMFPPRTTSCLPSTFLSAAALPCMPLWPPLTALPVSSGTVTAAAHVSGALQAMGISQQRLSLAATASPSTASQFSNSVYGHAAADTAAARLK